MADESVSEEHKATKSKEREDELVLNEGRGS